MAAPSFKIRDLAALVNGTVVGNCEIEIHGVAGLDDAEADQLSFLGNRAYYHRVETSRAAAVIVPPDYVEPPPLGRAWIVCERPSEAFGKIIECFAPPLVEYPPGRHPSAVVHPSARLADSVHVGPHAVVSANAVVGARSVIGAGVFLGDEAGVGEDCLIYPHVSIRERCLLGNRVIVHCGTVIGSDGYGYISGREGHAKIPQVGIVQIDDDVELGASVTVDRARFGRTWIKRGTKIDNLVQIAHNVVIGEHCLIIAQVGIAGSTHLGNRVTVAGQAGIAGHLTIGDGAVIAGATEVHKSIEPGDFVIGFPGRSRRDFARERLFIERGPKLTRAVKELQAEVEALRKRLDAS